MMCPGVKPEVIWLKRSRSFSWISTKYKEVTTWLKIKETNQKIKHPEIIWIWRELLLNFKFRITLQNIGNETLRIWLGKCRFFLKHSHLKMVFKNLIIFIYRLWKITPPMWFVLKRVLKLLMIIEGFWYNNWTLKGRWPLGVSWI